MSLLRSSLVSSAILLVVACSQGSCNSPPFDVVNPSGDCTADTNGDRDGYHFSQDTVYVPDCQNPLAREYWRVFATDPEHACSIPRFDGAPQLKPACDDPTDPLHGLVVRYRLCAPASSTEDVEIVNHMAIADALTLARMMHGTLRFTSRGSLAPFAPPTDILDACALRSLDAPSEIAVMCDRERARLEAGQDIGFSYEGAGAIELARRLNELYGIPDSATLPCVTYPDGVCDDAAQCNVWTMRRLVCAGPCDDPGSEVRSYCVRGGSREVLCRAEIATGDLFADMGGGDPDDRSNWRECTDEERETFYAALR